MTYTIQGGNVQTRMTKLTNTSVTTLIDGNPSGAIIIGIYATEIAGLTPSLTLDIWDGTTATYLRNAKALTAKEENQRDIIVVLKPGQSLRATATAANQIDVVTTYIPGDRMGKGGSL